MRFASLCHPVVRCWLAQLCLALNFIALPRIMLLNLHSSVPTCFAPVALPCPTFLSYSLCLAFSAFLRVHALLLQFSNGVVSQDK